MHFDSDRLYDGDDPLYAPGMNKSGARNYWKPTKKYIEAGWALKSYRLEGTPLEQAIKCRELTRKMMQWFNGVNAKIEPGTWNWLIVRYTTDRFSDFQRIKANSRKEYTSNLNRWKVAIGTDPIDNCNFTELMTWREAMIENGRSADYITRQFSILRRIARYGAALEDKECLRVSGIMANAKLSGGAKVTRTNYMLPEHVEAILKACDAKGEVYMPIAVLLQFEFALRAVDVRGQWFPALPKDTGGIMRNGRRWVDGITWDMFDRDVTMLSKVISKTANSKTEPMVFPIAAIPELQRRLLAIPAEERVGPLIKSREGLPYDKRSWAARFRKFANLAGVPEEIQLRDARAGAATDAEQSGARPLSIQNTLGHSQLSTTQIYLRGKNDSIAEVVELRQLARRGTNTKRA